MPELPSGTVTLLFTDIEGSTRLLQELGERYANVVAEHRRTLRDAFGRHGGVEVDTQGDAFFVAFEQASDALAAAADGQRALADGPVQVRMGVHTGEPLATDEGYVGIDVHRAARIMSAGHGGQVIVSERTRMLLDGGSSLTDLGLHRLKDLGEPEKLYQLGDAEFPPLKTLDATNLPVAATPLLGRERELEEALGLLHDGARLITITGPGGTGKTRFALQVAAELVGSLKDGVFWVPLAGLSDPELVLPTIGQTIGVRGDLAEHLRGKQLLLLLDNAEHLLAFAPKLADLLAVSPTLRFLVTSRAPLHLAGEHEYPLEPLATSDAVTLFVERARAAGGKVDPDATIEAICLRLDGLPLALELAAARTKLLAPATLLERLEHALPLLTGGARDAPERQRTLRATIEWSYDLLGEDAKRLFACLSIFFGSFSLDAAEKICDADLDTLQALIDFSLLKSIGESRFLMLETIREYAIIRFEEHDKTETMRDRHAQYFLALATNAAPELARPNSRFASDLLDDEMPNVRAALARVARKEPPRALRVAVDLYPFWSERTPLEGRRLLASLYRAEIDPELRMAALRALSHLAWLGHRHHVGAEVVKDVREAQLFAEERLELARAHGDAQAAAGSLSLLASIARRAGEVGTAERLGDEALDVARELDDLAFIGQLLSSRAVAEADFGDVDRALALFKEALDVFVEAGDERGVATAWNGIGVTRCRRGDWKQARGPLAEGLRFFDAAGNMRFVAVSLDHLAAVAAQTGAPARAARLFGAGDAAWASIGVPPEEAYRPPYMEEAMTAAKSALGHDVYELERSAGAAMTIDDAVRAALSVD